MVVFGFSGLASLALSLLGGVEGCLGFFSCLLSPEKLDELHAGLPRNMVKMVRRARRVEMTMATFFIVIRASCAFNLYLGMQELFSQILDLVIVVDIRVMG